MQFIHALTSFKHVEIVLVHSQAMREVKAVV